MEGLAPTARLCLEVQLGIECGEPIISILKRCVSDLDENLKAQVIHLLWHYEQYGIHDFALKGWASPERKALFAIILKGLSGEPILQRLKELEPEIRFICMEEIDRYIASLPTKSLIPVLLLQFPAFLVLLFGPLLQSLTKGILE